MSINQNFFLGYSARPHRRLCTGQTASWPWVWKGWSLWTTGLRPQRTHYGWSWETVSCRWWNKGSAQQPQVQKLRTHALLSPQAGFPTGDPGEAANVSSSQEKGQQPQTPAASLGQMSLFLPVSCEHTLYASSWCEIASMHLAASFPSALHRFLQVELSSCDQISLKSWFSPSRQLSYSLVTLMCNSGLSSTVSRGAAWTHTLLAPVQTPGSEAPEQRDL